MGQMLQKRHSDFKCLKKKIKKKLKDGPLPHMTEGPDNADGIRGRA